MQRHKAVEDGLAKVPIFIGLSPKELESIHSLLSTVNIPAGTVLASQGVVGHEFFIIESGTASVTRSGEHVADVGPGDFQGELSLIDGAPRTATVTATSPMTILVATQREFAQLLDTSPMIARRMLPTLVARLRAAAEDHHTH